MRVRFAVYLYGTTRTALVKSEKSEPTAYTVVKLPLQYVLALRYSYSLSRTHMIAAGSLVLAAITCLLSPLAAASAEPAAMEATPTEVAAEAAEQAATEAATAAAEPAAMEAAAEAAAA